MPDTVRSVDAFLNASTGLFDDNTAGDISAQDLRDFVLSVYRPQVAAGGRLTLTTAVPVTTSDVTGASTLYYALYHHNLIGLYDGTSWTLHTFAERSLALSGLTSGKNYDVFLYDNSGTLTLELSAAWTNDTTRADALATQDGVTVKSGATTRRWLGTIRTTGTTTTEDSEANRYVFNAANRVARTFGKAESAEAHTYNTSTLRNFNNTTDTQANFVCGAVEAAVEWGVGAKLGPPSGGPSAANCVVGMAVNGTDVAAPVLQFMQGGSNTGYFAGTIAYIAAPRLGLNTIIAREAGYSVSNGFENGVTFGKVFL
jgi:hypothetical protein